MTLTGADLPAPPHPAPRGIGGPEPAAGADPNAVTDFGLTPLHLAILQGDHAAVAVLTGAGADPRQLARDGLFPMGFAAAANSTLALRTLAAFCADFESPLPRRPGALDIAITAGADAAVAYLMAHGADLECLGEDGGSLLLRTCQAGQADVARALLAAGAAADHSNEDGVSVLDAAIASGRTKLFRTIALALPSGTVRSRLLAHWHAHALPAACGEPAVPRAFLLQSQLWLALRIGRERMLARWQRRFDQPARADLALFAALARGDPVAALAALRRGADPDARSASGTPALVAAASMGEQAGSSAERSALLGALLTAGACRQLRARDSGQVALHAACAGGQASLVSLLLADPAGRATLNLSDHQLDRPLHLVCRARLPALIALLAAGGADINPVNRLGLAPLHVAALAGDLETGAALLAHGANPALRTRQGLSVADCVPASHVAARDFLDLLGATARRRAGTTIFSPRHPLAGAARVGPRLPAAPRRP